WAQLAYVSFNEGDYPQARALYARSLTVLEELGSDVDTAGVLSGLGQTQRQMGDLSGALASVTRSAALFEKAGRSLARPLFEIGTVYEYMADYARALEFYQKALVAAEAAHDFLQVTSARLSIASVFQAHGDYEDALRSEQEA